MDEPGSDAHPRWSIERLALAGIGAVTLTAGRADALADELARRGGIRREDARETIDGMTARWRGEAVRLGERSRGSLGGLARELGLVTRDELDELQLRLAQLEHRLRLLEGEPPPAPRRL